MGKYFYFSYFLSTLRQHTDMHLHSHTIALLSKSPSSLYKLTSLFETRAISSPINVAVDAVIQSLKF